MTLPQSSRRHLLIGGAALATTAASQTLGAGSAMAAVTVNPYTATSVPNATRLHYMNRLGCGFSVSTYNQIRKIGTVAGWLDQQLAPASVAESATALAIPGWFAAQADSPATKWSKNSAKTKTAWQYSADLAGMTMLRRVYSTRQVFESMADFWTNHLHVNSYADLAWTQRASYDDTIRQHALGRFEDMLVAATLHPAMLLFLDSWKSTKSQPNENHGRELLELHTVGRASGYTEQMVKDSAKILSGYTVNAYSTWDAYYDGARHATGSVQVLGFTSGNTSSSGQQVTDAYLRYLANHPATALNIARKLARYFVADDPSTALVSAVASTFRSSGTDIKATLRTLVAHPDFLASQGRLVRTPIADFVATCRALDITATAPLSSQSFATLAYQVPATTPLYQWPRPDGSPYGTAHWVSPGRMLNSFRMHYKLVCGSWPSKEAVFRTPASWLPQPQIRFDQFVDHLCRSILGRVSTPRILGAAVAATSYAPTTLITRDHRMMESWLFTRLVSVLLDSPEHLQR